MRQSSPPSGDAVVVVVDVAGVALAVAVGVDLVGVGDERAVVGRGRAAVAVDVLAGYEEALGRVDVVRSRRGCVRAHPACREDRGDQRVVVVARGGVDAQDRLAHVEEVRRRAGDEDHRAGHELARPLDAGGATERRDQPAAQVPERARSEISLS